MKRAFKYRFYPTDAQAAELLRTFGCVRLVYNNALSARTTAWYQRQERVNYNATSAMLTNWKKEDDLAFLNEVSSVPLQQGLRHLQTAFSNFFAGRAEYPRFKSRKKSRASAEYTPSAFRFRDGKLTLAKMSSPLDIVWSRPLPEGVVPSTVTVSRDSAGRWFVSILCQDTITHHAPTDRVVGVDAGITSLVTLSTGQKVANPQHERKDRARLAKAQRSLSRKQKGSVNRAKARKSVCGTIREKLPLNVRTWTCGCGVTLDRDVNAAINIRAAGLAAAACGAGVRPRRESSRTGQSAGKQEGHGATRDEAKASNHR